MTIDEGLGAHGSSDNSSAAAPRFGNGDPRGDSARSLAGAFRATGRARRAPVTRGQAKLPLSVAAAAKVAAWIRVARTNAEAFARHLRRARPPGAAGTAQALPAIISVGAGAGLSRRARGRHPAACAPLAPRSPSASVGGAFARPRLLARTASSTALLGALDSVRRALRFVARVGRRCAARRARGPARTRVARRSARWALVPDASGGARRIGGARTGSPTLHRYRTVARSRFGAHPRRARTLPCAIEVVRVFHHQAATRHEEHDQDRNT